MRHFEEGHIEQDYFVQERRRDQGLEVHCQKKGLVVAGTEAVLVENC